MPEGQVYFVAANGNDSSGDGSVGKPWATIGKAVVTAADGATVLVKAGTYNGRVRLDRAFAKGLVIRSEQPYRARLRHNEPVVTVYQGQGITLEGFDIAHIGSGATPLVIQIQNLRDDNDYVQRITLRNNVIHDSYNNDLVKLNNGAGKVVFERNLFYNQAGSDEHIDINSVTDVVVQDNIFMNDFTGSGRRNNGETSAYVVIKDSNGADGRVLGTRGVQVRRNVFLNWQGSPGYNFVLIGEDGTANHEASDILIENNLMLGNSSQPMRAAFGVKGSKEITFRHNTVAGNLPSAAYAMRLNREGSNPRLEKISFFNNIWSDPTGTMEDFSDTPPADTASFTLRNNLYWNGGQEFPADQGELVKISDDAAAVKGDPRLGAQQGLALPRWNEQTGKLGDGSSTICEAFENLVTRYGTPAAGSAALNVGDAAQAPRDDILGRARAAKPDLGAVEVP
jgi:hypothetical protein